MKRTVSLITANFDKYSPDSIDEYEEIDGFSALKKSFSVTPNQIIEEMRKAELYGRGGAAYPVGRKMKESALYDNKDDKYVVCNADEGEPGTFKDRDLLEKDPLGVIEGMIITAYAVNANKGYIYLREEYKHISPTLDKLIEDLKARNYLGKNILGTGFDFNIKVFLGAGAYICGEGTSLIESIEGKPGRPRNKPPYSKEKGLFDKPTHIHNVETLSAIKTIMKIGSNEFIKYGTEKSKGSKLISLCGNVKRPGTYEVPFGITLREIVYDLGEGIPNGKSLKFLQLGGVSGTIFPSKYIDTPLSYEDFQKMGLSLGSGAILVADEDTEMIDFIEAVGAFFLHESCGKCTPCREGNRQLMKIYGRISRKEASTEDIKNLEKIAHVMKNASFCGLGKTAPTALLATLNHCPEELYGRSVKF